MLKQRIVTASVLASFFLFVLFYGVWEAFALFTGAVFLLAGWEWSNLSGLSSFGSRSAYTLATFLLALGVAWYVDWGLNRYLALLFFSAICIWWACTLALVKWYPASASVWGGVVSRMLMGWLILIPAWIACLFLRHETMGSWLILLVVLLVATADIAAFFAGRAYGKKKLAPAVSPGKSWEGVWAGMAAAAALGLLYNLLLEGGSWLSLILIVLPTAFVSVLGDLVESMVKRHRGVKDSGLLLPGHGGVLDRVDGLVAAAPTFSLMVLLTGWSLQ